jgi:c(7)-type cytochrome triheme protein
MPWWAVICLALVLLPAGEASANGLGDMVMDKTVESMKKASVGPVIFPHTRHEEILKCNECHPKIFKEKRGVHDLSMQNIMDGNSCGSPSCHNSARVFPLYLCIKCHTKIRAAQ